MGWLANVCQPVNVQRAAVSRRLDTVQGIKIFRYVFAEKRNNLSLIVTQCCTHSSDASDVRKACKIKNGLAGECMPTGECSKSGGQSEAGHCPGDEDIQVCYC